MSSRTCKKDLRWVTQNTALPVEPLVPPEHLELCREAAEGTLENLPEDFALEHEEVVDARPTDVLFADAVL